MAFADLLDEVGGFGRFQWIHVALLSVPGLLMASQNLLNNFTAGVPDHYCSVPNASETRNLSREEVLRVFVPPEGTGFSRCRRYIHPRWELLVNGSQAEENQTEPCLDGWSYQRTEFVSTIVSEVRARGFVT